jgi:uncharacterized protein (DUF1015 family)
VQIPPSYRTSADRPVAGLELAPFRGVRYAQDRVSGLADVTSPPYDVIFRDNEDQLMAADPHNVVRLILPRPNPDRPGEEYRDAAVLLRRWLTEQILVADPEPALYVYEQAESVNGAGSGSVHQPYVPIQRGLIGRLRLVPPEAGIVLPHEDVNAGPVAGRLQLMEATQANLEPIFLLYDGDAAESGSGPAPGAASAIVAETAAGAPLLEARTSDGLRHRLWAITDPAQLAAIAADLAPRQALIADGHHRYAAYRGLQERRRSAGDGAGPWDYGLALLVDSSIYPPQIGAIHRIVPGLEVQQAAKLAGGAFTVQPLAAGEAQLPAAMEALAVASATGPAFVLAGGGCTCLLTEPDPDQAQAAMPDGRSREWQALPAAVLQELLINRLWGLADDDRSVKVMHHDAIAAVRAAEAAGGTAVLCSPMSPAEVYEVAARGEKVPRKSTSFAPKPRTGLVLRMFAQG